MQVCLTLPLACNERSQAVALAYAERMGLTKSRVTWMEPIGPRYTYYIIYGESQHTIDAEQVPVPAHPLPMPARTISDLDQAFRRRIGRRVQVFAVSDAAAEAFIDFEAVLSLKGVSGEIGLEGYTTFILKRQRNGESIDDLMDKIIKAKPDVLLVLEPADSWGRGEGGLKDLCRKVKKSKALPPWLVSVCWREDPAKAEQALGEYDFSVARGIAPGRLADRIVEQLSQNGLDADSASRSEKDSPKKKRFLGIFGRSN